VFYIQSPIRTADCLWRERGNRFFLTITVVFINVALVDICWNFFIVTHFNDKSRD